MAAQEKSKEPVSVLLFDLDHFKSINDRFGHAAGDETIKLFATTVASTMRATDIIGRFGGEEFVAMIPGDLAEAAVAAERVRTAFQAAAVEVAGHHMAATVSIGAASGEATAHIETLIAQADAALYRAKRNGRNRLETADELVLGVDASAGIARRPSAGIRSPQARHANPAGSSTARELKLVAQIVTAI